LKKAAGAHYCSEPALRERERSAGKLLLQRLSKAQTLVSIKTILIVAVIALIAAGWYFRDSKTLVSAATSAQAFVKDVLPDDGKAAAKADAEKKSAGKGADAKGPHSLRKCVSEGRTVYTDEKCPAGTREAPISEGNVTVMPSQRAGGKPKGEEKAK